MNHWSARRNIGDCFLGALLTEIEVAAGLTVRMQLLDRCEYNVIVSHVVQKVIFWNCTG